jgi:hypothetical protein
LVYISSPLIFFHHLSPLKLPWLIPWMFGRYLQVIWGLIGPEALGGLYSAICYGLLVGALLPVPFYFLAKRYTTWFKYINIPMLLNVVAVRFLLSVVHLTGPADVDPSLFFLTSLGQFVPPYLPVRSSSSSDIEPYLSASRLTLRLASPLPDQHFVLLLH